MNKTSKSVTTEAQASSPKSFARVLLVFTALLLAFAASIHASAFTKTFSFVDASTLPRSVINGFKVLWLADSAIQLVLAATFGFVAVRPAAARRPVIVLLALIPAATAGLLYTFMGPFIGPHVLLASAVTAVLAGLQYPGVDTSVRPRLESNST